MFPFSHTPRKRRRGYASRWPSDDPWLLRFLRLLLGIATTPMIVGLGKALLDAAIHVDSTSRILSLDSGIFAFIAGFSAFLLAYALLPRPTRAYVWAHEMTHVLFARLHGARAKTMKVGHEEGSVVLSRTHLLTLLAPYFFPLYTLMLTLLLLALSLFIPHARIRLPGFALLGISWGFHACFTLNSMLQHQTDLQRSGYVFSYALIALLNLLMLALGFLVLTPYPAAAFLWKSLDHSVAAYGALWGAGAGWLGRLRQIVQR